MADNTFTTTIKTVNAAAGPMRSIVRGMRDIIQAARGVAKSSAEGAKAAAHAGSESSHAVKRAAEGVVAAGRKTEDAIHGVEKTEAHAEASHIRYFRSLGAHVRLMHGHFGELNASIGEVGNSLKEFLPALGALGAGGSLVGMFEMTHEAAEQAIVMDAAAKKIGVTAKQYAGLTFAAKESGLAGDTMVRSMERLNRTMGDSAIGKNKDAAGLFAHLRITKAQLQGPDAMMRLLPQLADAFKATKDPTMQARMAFTLFGRAGQDLLPILVQGREGLSELIKAGANFADFGSDEQREKLKEFGHSWGEMDAAAEGFKTRLATELAPALNPVVEAARDWIMANRDWIAQGLAKRVKVLADAFKGIDLKALLTSFAHFVDETAALTRGHGELLAIVGGVTLVLSSPLAGAVKNAVGAFTTFTSVIRGLSVLMVANPFGAFVIAAVAVGAVAYEIYEHWDWVKGKLAEIWDAFSHSVWAKIAVDTIKPFIFLPEQIYENWTPIKAYFTGLWDGVTGAFKDAWAYISPIVDQLKSAVSWVQGSWLGRHLGGGVDAVAKAAPVNTARAAMPRLHNPYVLTDLGDDGGFRNPWAHTAASAPQSLYRPDGPAAQNLQLNGKVQVQVALTGAPPGTKVSSSASGIAQPPDTSIGYSNPLGGYSF